jgi:hypothetical protein
MVADETHHKVTSPKGDREEKKKCGEKKMQKRLYIPGRWRAQNIHSSSMDYHLLRFVVHGS